MRDETVKVVVAQLMIGGLAGLALWMGHNGIILGAALGSLANLGGYFTGRKKTDAEIIEERNHQRAIAREQLEHDRIVAVEQRDYDRRDD